MSKLKKIIKFVPILILLLGLILFYYFDFQKYLSISSLQENYQQLTYWKNNNLLAAAAFFSVLYVFITACSIPGAAIITIAGGFLFGFILGSTLVIISATLGATLIFLAAKTSFGAILEEMASSKLKSFKKGFNEDAFNYLLFLRLVPIFPFWLINIVPAFLNVNLKTYFIATFLGIIPGSAVYVAVGNGLGSLLEKNQTPNLAIIFKPEIFLPIIGLAVLSIIPIAYKKLRKDKQNGV